MLLSGLLEYDEALVAGAITTYNAGKTAFATR